jgi:hypothetical protein
MDPEKALLPSTSALRLIEGLKLALIHSFNSCRTSLELHRRGQYFNQVSSTYDPVVVFLDLASEMLAGASMEDISTVLYLKVLQWAGYSEDLKVAELERMLEKDGKLGDFEKRVRTELDGIEWRDVHNQPLVANPIAARMASELYPKLFPRPEDFQSIILHVSKAEIARTAEMIELIRRKSGKKNIIFIVDEVGQYVSAKPSLILNLDGLAKNLLAWISRRSES